jgi:hypothetical protein
MPAGLDHVSNTETWPPALPDLLEIFDSEDLVTLGQAHGLVLADINNLVLGRLTE